MTAAADAAADDDAPDGRALDGDAPEGSIPIQHDCRVEEIRDKLLQFQIGRRVFDF